MVEIQKNYKDINLKKKELCISPFKFLYKCEEEIWNKLLGYDDDKNLFENKNKNKIELIDTDTDIDSKECDTEEENDLNDLTKKFRSLRI